MKKSLKLLKSTALILSVLLIASCGGTAVNEMTAAPVSPTSTATAATVQELTDESETDTEIISEYPDSTAPYPEDTALSTDTWESGEISDTLPSQSTHPLQETEPETEPEITAGLETAPAAAETPSAGTAPVTYETVTTSARSYSPAPGLETISGTSYNVMGDNNVLVSFQNGHYVGLMGAFGTYSMCDRWVNGINCFAKNLPGVNVWSMVVPLSSEYYTPDGFGSEFTVSQLSRISYIAGGLSGAVNVDAHSALKAHMNEPIYARTDHHWNPLGAYYAAREFAVTAGFDIPELSQYREVSYGGYVGTMYTYSNDINLYNDPEDFVMYIPQNNSALDCTYYTPSFTDPKKYGLFLKTDASMYYCSFLGSDSIIAHINTDVKNGRTLVVFKESYGNALIPFLTYGFENIYVCDIRYFDLDGIQFCKDRGATDVLFAVCTMTAAGSNGKYIDTIISGN